MQTLLKTRSHQPVGWQECENDKEIKNRIRKHHAGNAIAPRVLAHGKEKT
jgi:hypothetical protein